MQIFELAALRKPFVYHGFHGTYADDLPTFLNQNQFGGLHIGSKRAAMQRLDDIRGSSRMGRPGGENIIPVTVTLYQPYGPIDETELFILLNLKGRLNALKEAGFDGIIYKNIVEHPGSYSVLAFYRNSVKKRMKG